MRSNHIKSTFRILRRALQNAVLPVFCCGLWTLPASAQLGIPPTIAVQPLGVSVQNGGTAVLTSTAISLTSMSFQWYVNDQPVSPANSTVVNVVVPLVGTVSTLTVANVIPANAGRYRVKVINGAGSVQSSEALVTVVGGISVDNSSQAETSGSANLTWSHTVGTGSNRFLVVSISTANGTPVSSVTYGGASLEKIGAIANPSGPGVSTEMWSLTDPAAGTAEASVTLTGTARFTAGATSYFGVDQSKPLGSFVQGIGNGDAPKLTVASGAGEVVIDSVAAHAAKSGTSGTGQSMLWSDFTGTSGGDVWGSGSFKPGAASVPMSWTLSGSGAGEWAAGAVALKPAGPEILPPVPQMTGDGFACRYSSLPSATYVVLASTDLVNWTPVATNSVTSGVLDFLDSTARNRPACFYRLVAR